MTSEERNGRTLLMLSVEISMSVSGWQYTDHKILMVESISWDEQQVEVEGEQKRTCGTPGESEWNRSHTLW